jgi:hypothetical protein
MNRQSFLVLLIALTAFSCSQGSEEPKKISLQSVTINGTTVDNSINDIPVSTSLAITFDAALDIEKFNSLVSVSAGSMVVPVQFSFTNAGTRAVAALELDYQTTYTLEIKAGVIGQAGQLLENGRVVLFTTAQDDVIRRQEPCSGVGNCLQTVSLTGENGNGNFEFYGNYPLYEDKAQWEELTNAIIVVHGLSRNADDYYTYINNSLMDLDLENSTILISPYFKDEASSNSGDYFWNTSGWRSGQSSSDDAKISSFQVVDSLMAQLFNRDKFPVLEKVIVTGHSSGGLFTNVYVGASEFATNQDITVNYVVANSQYFYYSNNSRYNEANQIFYEPTDCPTFNDWPMGYKNIPAVLSGITKETFETRFAARETVYLLGNGTQPDGSLNTTSCQATLLGSNRYNRGLNRYLFMEEYYPGNHDHRKIIVDGVGHDGQAMYSAEEFKNYLTEFLN